MKLENISVNEQSSIRIEGSKILYFDAFRINEVKHDADVIFITHEHFDHYDIGSITNVKKSSSIIVAPETMKDKLMKDGMADLSRDIFLSPGADVEIDGIKVKGVSAYNMTKPFHPKTNNWLGYILEMDGVSYYIAGDTDALEENKAINCDIAFLPIGGGYTMDKQEAYDFTEALMPKVVIPTHYGDVVGSPEDGNAFMKLLEASKVQVVLKL